MRYIRLNSLYLIMDYAMHCATPENWEYVALSKSRYYDTCPSEMRKWGELCRQINRNLKEFPNALLSERPVFKLSYSLLIDQPVVRCAKRLQMVFREVRNGGRCLPDFPLFMNDLNCHLLQLQVGDCSIRCQ